MISRRHFQGGLLASAWAGGAWSAADDGTAAQARAADAHKAAVAADFPDVTAWVDPFIGTDGTGHVTPAAAVPFGMVMPGPDHADRGWDYASGYQFRAPRTLGFSNTHISGAGIPELGDVLLMPSVGRHWNEGTTDFSSAHDKASETAQPGYYAITLPDHGLRVELSCTARVAVHRWTALRSGPPGGEVFQVLVDLQHGLVFADGPNGQQGRVTEATADADAPRGELWGRVVSRNWVEREASFVLRFSQPVQQIQRLPAGPNERAPRFLLSFAPPPGGLLEARVALSTVDVAGARRNLEEATGGSFEQVREAARSRWRELLSRWQIDADSRTRRIFYSALYRACLHPSNIADVDGRVRGPRGQVIQLARPRYDSTFSLWDSFRAVHPLHTLLVPERVPGYVDSLVRHQRQMGFLPLWTAWGRESFCMIGNPAMPVLADAVSKGLVPARSARAALQAMLVSATRPRPDAPEWAQRDWALYQQFGHLPIDRYSGGEAVSKALEYGIGDDALARVAAALGDSSTARRFARRAAGWRQLFDSATQVMRGRRSDGRWREPFDPLAATSPLNNPGDYTEANAWQYTATPALHDPLGFRALLGGPAALEAWLDRFFSLPMPHADKHLGQEAMIGQLAHGNEPSHHIPWLYAFTAHPEKGHALVERIAREFYSDAPDGILGNDDCGQMGAWFVMACLGLYPVQPAAGCYVLGQPLVKQARLWRSGRPPLELMPSARSGAWLDAQPVDRTRLSHRRLLAGHQLKFGTGA